ncbi:MAG: 3-isopropylmalate dehydratase large subunit [Gammaproteobacteria bacterium]|nr:3-isopropylmalate dehydratase large subunit [Gammaproteobacteria bacterium]MDP6147311.1 3-isopropylmalate dehydratase large subunit [Gammaproteobacteria bacterium]HJN00120.1 3-isopropylmalate dehydratase large subunit [Gammaproteobacteria bacterium]
MAESGKTLFEKVWEDHLVVEETPNTPAILYIDLHLIHEVTTPQAFQSLRDKGLSLRDPNKVLATMDHSTPTLPVKSIADLDIVAEKGPADQIRDMIRNCEEFGVELHGFDSDKRGIVHVMGPELGATQPGKTIVCGDSHTSTHGAFGALAFGIGTTEVGHVLASQCLLQRKPKTFAVNMDGSLRSGVSAKDIILKIIQKVGVDGGVGHVIEYRGSTAGVLSLEERMTICNMSIEAGARAGMFAPDDKTFNYLIDKPMSPKGPDWDQAMKRWSRLVTDEDVAFDKEVNIDIDQLSPMVTYGTNPGMAMEIDGVVPETNGDLGFKQSLNYMQIEAGKPLIGKDIDVVFIGSCTNSRISDLKDAAEILKDRKVSDGVKALVVPGSQAIKKEAESLGLDKIFESAGAEWREPGCSMCLGMNGDTVGNGKLAVSTSNRNFEGRQGKGARTILASPKTAAASAISGSVEDPRKYS